MKDLVAARRMLRTDRANDASVLLAHATSIDWPCRDLAWILLGRARLAQGDAAGAVEASLRAEGAVEDGVRVADAHWLRAEALEKVDAAAAVEAHRSFAAKWPDDPRAADSAARVAAGLEASKKDAEAADAWRDAGRGAEGEAAAKASVERARSLSLLRRNDEARATCEDALLEHPASPVAAECHLILTRLARRTGDTEAVRAQARRALSDPRWQELPWRSDVEWQLAETLADDGQWLAAAAAYEGAAAHAVEARRGEASWRAGWCLWRAGCPAEAAQAWQVAAMRLDVEDAVGRRALLWEALARERASSDGSSVVLARNPLDLLKRLATEVPWTYDGLLARDLLSARLAPEELAVVDAVAFDSGVIFEDPGPPNLRSPGGLRYLLLKEAELDDEALDEIEALAVDASVALQYELAGALSRAGHARRARALLLELFPKAVTQPSRRSPREFCRILHPGNRLDVVDRCATAAGIDTAWACAVISADSGWDADARSAAGAWGLMQLIPQMAQAIVSSSKDLDPRLPHELEDPDVNVFLGTRHLAELLTRFEGDEVLATAAYNAGPGAVSRWWASFDREGVVLVPEQIERIPFAETRMYVRRVIEERSWYRWLAE